MANDGKIYITISDKRGGASPTPGVPESKPTDKSEKGSDNVLQSYIQHQFLNVVKNNAMKAINYSISNIGNFTGDYTRQNQIESTKQAVDFLMGLGMSALAGAKYGPTGSLVAVGVNLISQGVTYGLQEHSANVAINQQNRRIERMYNISGLSVLNNGSRGTES